jgi:hypothetical protein
MAAKDLICTAIRSKRLLQFSYGSHTRVVELTFLVETQPIMMC